MDEAELQSAVRAVIDAVRQRGDEALCEFTERWDGIRLAPGELRVPPEAIDRVDLSSPFAAAFRRAAGRIRAFHEQVKPRSTMMEDADGVRMGLRWTALQAAGLYIPGGKAAYPSTLAMTAIPAQIAGVERIAVVSPPGPGGEVSPHVLMAARILGLTEIYRIGGSQAIAALAIGTGVVRRVDKIFGPGNAFVAEAKRQLYGEVGIDLLAGPSEIVVYADHTAEPEWVAADLMAQAEHDESTRVTLLASSESVLASVRAAMDRLVASEARSDIIRASWAANGRFEVVPTAALAAARIDAIAPEHLSLQVEKPWEALTLVRNAGAIFLGAQSPVAIGDYYAGPNHCLPTGTTARFASCLSVEDFMKRSNLCELSMDFLARRGEDVETLAGAERLPAHATSVRLRREAGARPRARRGVRSVTPYLLVEEDAEVKLNQNESPWDVPPEVKAAVADRLEATPWNRYHQRLPAELRERIARETGVTPQSVLVASGSNLLLQWIFEAYAAPGDTILLPRPSFSLYPLWADVCEARVATVPLTRSFAYDVPGFQQAIRHSSPALTVLCLPNNPTGTELGVQVVREMADAAGERGGLLVVDEAYREFSDPRYDRTALVRDLDNVILVRTFSKAYAVAGMRLGYLLASPPIAVELEKMVPPFHLSLFGAVLGMTVLDHRAVFEERVRMILHERGRMIDALRSMRGVDVVASEANFFLMRVADANAVYAGLEERGILVRRPGQDELLTGALRVNVGTPEENDRFLEAVARLVGAGKAGR